jgi:hypothetical protein
MFLPINCSSVNKRPMVAEAVLTGTCSHYQSLDCSADMLLYEYDGSVSKKMIACDLVVYARTGEIYMNDFLLLNDGNWRNAFGFVSDTLSNLIPEIVLTAKLLNRELINEFSIEGDHV